MAKSVFDPTAGESEPVFIPVTYETIVAAFQHAMINNGHGWDDVIKMIVKLDLMCANWDVTEKLIAHFKAVEIEMMKEGEAEEPVKPKKIEV